MRFRALLIAPLLVLSACAGPAGDSPGGGTPSPEDSHEPTEMSTLLDIDCPQLLTPGQLEAAFGVAVPERPPQVEGYGGLYGMSTVALELAGATRCSWGDGNSAGDHYLDLELLPHAGADFARFESDIRLFQTIDTDAGDSGAMSCTAHPDGDSCRADIRVGDVWASVIAYGIDGTDAIGPLLSAVAVAVGETTAGDIRQVPALDCAALLATDTVRSVVSAELDAWEDRGAVLQPVIREAAFERMGGSLCSWRNSFSSATAVTVDLAVLPGADELFDTHFAAGVPDTVTQNPVDDGWSGLLELRARGIQNAYASLLADDVWIDVWVNRESMDDDRAPALELARSVFTSLADTAP